MPRPSSSIAFLCVLGAAALPACAGEDPTLPDEALAVREVSLVAAGGFQLPIDAVASPEGDTFYFAAHTLDDPPKPTLLRVPSGGGAASPLLEGAPLVFPTGLVLSCDGRTLYVADAQSPVAEPLNEHLPAAGAGAVFAVDVESGAAAPLASSLVAMPHGLALEDDCDTLHLTGWTQAGEPALFTHRLSTGEEAIVHEGAPLVAPRGLHVDPGGVNWVMDSLAGGPSEAGTLFAIDAAGEASKVLGGLGFGAGSGCSTNNFGVVAVVPSVNEEGSALTQVRLSDGASSVLGTPEIDDVAGLRTARSAPVFAIADRAGGRIFRGE